MSALPRKGEIQEAIDVLNARLSAAFGIEAGQGERAVTELGESALTFGDLFDTAEMNAQAFVFGDRLVGDVAEGLIPPLEAFMTAFRQGGALGAMVERRRWEAQARERRAA